MSWRSWLFPPSQAAHAQKAIRDAPRDLEAVMRPISDLAVAIVSASWRCTQEVKSHLQVNPEFTKAPWSPQDQDIYMFYEFLYFFMHLINREAHRRLPIDKLEALQQTVAPLIVQPAAIDAFFGHWPDKFKDEIETGFYDKLNDAEGEYANCKKLLPATGEMWLFDETALSSRLAMNVLSVSGYEVAISQPNPETLMLGKLIETAAMAKLVDPPSGNAAAALLSSGGLQNLGQLVEQASAGIDLSESQGWPLAEMFREYRAAQKSVST